MTDWEVTPVEWIPVGTATPEMEKFVRDFLESVQRELICPTPVIQTTFPPKTISTARIWSVRIC